MSAPTIARLHVEVKVLDADFRSYPCPRCGTESPRHAGATRHAVDIGLERPILLQIKVGVYRCPRCYRSRLVNKANFRTPLAFLPPRHSYVERCRRKLVEAVELDQMTIGRAVQRLERDFNVTIAPSTGWEWHHQHHPGDRAIADYEHLVAERFSGVLCVDEVYDGDYAILCARDPLTGRTVAYELCEAMNQEVVIAFFSRLKTIGIVPEVTITDASPLYPKALRTVWGACRHQLCRFHWTKDVIKEVMLGIKQYRESLPKPKKRHRRGPAVGKDRADHRRAVAAKSARDEVRKGRFLLVTHPENVTPEREKELEKLLSNHPGLGVVRDFAVDFYGLFKGKPRASEARRRWQCLVSNPRYVASPLLAGAMKSILDAEKFEKVCVYLHYKNLDSTSNDVERDNRGYRKRQKTHYRFRAKASIQRILKRRLLRDGPPPPSRRLQRRFGAPGKVPSATAN